MKIKTVKYENVWLNPLHITQICEVRIFGGNITVIQVRDNSWEVAEEEMTYDQIVSAVETELSEIIPAMRHIEYTGPK
jgi:hypothetical protein